ncbi:MAG: macro domain-containing protein [Oscillospiraceae bacterium]|nr:macro domain-containing protein [Oscillospiraceae bacterium]
MEVKCNTGLRRLLGLGIGSVSVSSSCDPANPVIQVIPPAWKQGEQDEWNILEQCYAQVLRLAVKYHCDAVTIPLLTADEPDFPAYIDYKIAVDTIRKFLESHTMDVFLMASRQSAFQIPELRRDVEQFLSRNFFDDLPGWSSICFADSDSRFATITPAPTLHEEVLCPPTPAPSKASYSKYSTGRLPSMSELEDMLKHTDAGFSETLLKLIDKTGKKDSEIYNKANVSRQHFSKIRNNPDYKPTKPTAIAFAIALELDMEQTRDLIGRAGYTLTNSSKFDVIIMYFIQNRNYNMFDINDTLYEFDQSLLGA